MSWCRVRRLVVAAGVGVLVGVPTGGVLVGGEPVGATEFRAQTWNVARGNSSIRDAYNTRYGTGRPGFMRQGEDVIWNAYAYTLGNPVWSFSLQEVCRAMVTEIARALNNTFGHARYFPDFGRTAWDDSGKPRHEQACEGFGGEYGNGILAIGVPIRGEEETFRHHPPGVTHERKGIRCVKMMSWGFNTLNCSTHLTPSNRDNEFYKFAQASEAHALTTWWAAAETALEITGADFNINFTPPLSGMREEFERWYWGRGWHAHDEAWVYHSADTRRPTTKSGSKMIDYVWVRYPQFRQVRDPDGRGRLSCGPVWYNPDGLLISDHRLCPGRFWHGG